MINLKKMTIIYLLMGRIRTKAGKKARSLRVFIFFESIYIHLPKFGQFEMKKFERGLPFHDVTESRLPQRIIATTPTPLLP